MTETDLNILIQHATRERDLMKGHARELNAAADTCDALLSAIKELKETNANIVEENSQLKKELQVYKNAPKKIINQFNAPIGNNIQHADTIYAQPI